MKKLAIAPLLAGLIAAPLSPPATAQTAVGYESSPVEIVRYSIEQAYPRPITGYGATTTDVGGLPEARISFVNVGNTAATRVKFAIRSRNNSEQLVDTGTFSPHANITHTFSVSADAGASIQVESVDFADGTSWQAR